MTSSPFEAIKDNPQLWDTFTLKDEYEEGIRDIYGRLPHPLADHVKTIDPVISRYLIKRGLDLKYPDGKRFCVCLTHDIDNLMISARRGALDSLKSLTSGDLSEAVSNIKASFSRSGNPLFNFDQIMDLEEKYRARSTFFFLSLSKGDRDFNYDLRDIRGELKAIADRGFEIGLHGGHSASGSRKRIIKEKSSLESMSGATVTGYRGHFLRFRYPHTWRHLERSGFRYDSTMSYSNSIGWKNGTCHPFIPYDRDANRFMRIWEIPLAVMDRTLIGRMGLDHDNSMSLMESLFDKVSELKGILTINWHNSEYSNENGPLYERILRSAHDRGAWMASASDITELVSKQISGS